MFLDTNALVRAQYETAPNHAVARARILKTGQSGEALRISRQIVREYLATVTRPQSWSPASSMNVALAQIAEFEANFEILEDGPQVAEKLAMLCREVPLGGRQIHDANIVATMLAHGERRLLTFNAADFRRYCERIELVEMQTPG
ncbi:MAG: PIN domain-containing protein [Rhodospirillaceae bacterium]|nr:PIN domain-containing protein [Rhodospirillaceae bacterium]